MQLRQDWLLAQGEDAPLLQVVDTAFFPETPDKIGVAVSGGGDSMALLHVFWRWSVQTGQPIEAVTVDHGLRPDAALEAAGVAAFCNERHIPHSILKWNGADAVGNVQAAAREARYQLISDWAKASGIGGIALGHTADDIAETFLMRLARKAGVDGLAAMEARFERKGVLWARPFWQQTRTGLRSYLKRQNMDWIDDPTNDDATYERTRARQVLAALAPLGVEASDLKDTASALRMAASALSHYTAQEVQTHVTQDRGDLLIPRRTRPPIHPEIERRILMAAFRWIGGGDYPPRQSALVTLEAELALKGGSQTLAGCLVSESPSKDLRISREFNAVKTRRCPTTQIWDGRWQIIGPHAPGLEVRALGHALKDCPDWRETGLPRASLMASPAVWKEEALIAAPLAAYNPDWDARIVTDFASFMLSH